MSSWPNHDPRLRLIALGILMAAMLPGLAYAQDYSASHIPAALRAHAHAVIRNEETRIRLERPNEVWITVDRTVTVLDADGRYQGAVQVFYNKSRPVESLSATLYDAEGRQLRRFKRSDFEDVSQIQDYSLFEDERVKRLLPSAPAYPYTVRYSSTQKYKFSFYLPRWNPLPEEGVALEKASLDVTAPRDVPLRYFGNHVDNPVIDTAGDTRHYRWQVAALPAARAEAFSPPFLQSASPYVLCAPERFEYYGMEGSYQDWAGYGRWVYENLLQGRDALPQRTVEKIRALCAGLSPLDAAKKIYAYVQQKSRYVSIQIGKGGFVPMKASEVDKLGYGDCKALVNYTMALLKAAGMQAYYTEVHAGEEGNSLLPGFASPGQGNHIILCLPLDKDTVWLECTDKHIPFGYLGAFTDDRNVLICTPAGGILAHTPRYGEAQNRLARHVTVVLDSAGNMEGQVNSTFRGLLYTQRADFPSLTPRDRDSRLTEAYSFLQMAPSHYRLDIQKERLPMATERFAFTAPRYAGPMGGGLSVPLNPVDRFSALPPLSADRRAPVFIHRGYDKRDTVDFQFPQGWRPAWLPADTALHTDFGDYRMHLVPGRGSLRYIREFRLHGGTFAAAEYAAFTRFLRQVAMLDRIKFLLSPGAPPS